MPRSLPLFRICISLTLDNFNRFSNLRILVIFLNDLDNVCIPVMCRYAPIESLNQPSNERPVIMDVNSDEFKIELFQ